jgi:hypothetical protein
LASWRGQDELPKIRLFDTIFSANKIEVRLIAYHPQQTQEKNSVKVSSSSDPIEVIIDFLPAVNDPEVSGLPAPAQPYTDSPRILIKIAQKARL